MTLQVFEMGGHAVVAPPVGADLTVAFDAPFCPAGVQAVQGLVQADGDPDPLHLNFAGVRPIGFLVRRRPDYVMPSSLNTASASAFKRYRTLPPVRSLCNKTLDWSSPATRNLRKQP